MPKKLLTKGFTLIELLVVVAIIGILAVLLILAINPVEQINKSRDSAAFQDADELNRALQRFYTANGCYPWDWAQGSPCLTTTAWPGTPQAYTALTGTNSLTATGIATTFYKLGSSGSTEVNQNLITRLTSSAYSGTNNTVASAFLNIDVNNNPQITYYPRSNAYHIKATYNNTCVTTSGGNYVCLPGTAF